MRTDVKKRGAERARWPPGWRGAGGAILTLGVESALIVTTAVTLLGIAFCALCGLPWRPCLPYWIPGTYAVYATHRLVLASGRARGRTPAFARVPQALVAGACVLWLLAHPILSGHPALALVMAGALLIGGAYSYGLPTGRIPWRELPWVKSLVPAAVAIAALGGLPCWFADGLPPARPLAAGGAWLAALLTWNVLWCDWRDATDDRAVGVRSLPVALGTRRSRHLLRLLQITVAAAGCLAAPGHPRWPAAGLLTALAMEPLLRARSPRRSLATEILPDAVLAVPILALIGADWN